ncbi:NAD(P)H-hydrate dehydratase [Chloroflexota bacterium]
MLLIAGTMPNKDIPLTFGQVKADGDHLMVDGQRILCTQGTGAMISAALAATSHLGLDAPHVLIAGDIGKGDGSRAIYDYLIDNIAEIAPKVLALHYWLPNMAQSKQLCEAIKKCKSKPIMIADAASMYSAKAAGLAAQFDIFTPDATEIAFLADPLATHPAYVQKHLFDTDITQTPSLVEAAYKHKSAAKLLLVKGSIDYIVKDGDIIETINEPDVPALEAIGGTGDTITGLVSAFAYGGLELHEAAILATRVNRTAGQIAKVTPATKVSQLIGAFPAVLKENLCQWSEVCLN